MLAVSSSSSKPLSAAGSGTSTSNAAAVYKMPSRSALGRHTEPAHASSRHRQQVAEALRTSAGPSRKWKAFCTAAIPTRTPPPPPPPLL